MEKYVVSKRLAVHGNDDYFFRIWRGWRERMPRPLRQVRREWAISYVHTSIRYIFYTLNILFLYEGMMNDV